MVVVTVGLGCTQNPLSTLLSYISISSECPRQFAWRPKDIEKRPPLIDEGFLSMHPSPTATEQPGACVCWRTSFVKANCIRHFRWQMRGNSNKQFSTSGARRNSASRKENIQKHLHTTKFVHFIHQKQNTTQTCLFISPWKKQRMNATELRSVERVPVHAKNWAVPVFAQPASA